ncbi:unnamed protein product [Allacma fusca]|uniref:Uncharacterized protein n=1 Tax=Allacma fusca TaxID=39272 RepID=A0A8J2NQS3_9HEXA|nr:unnamed protein product [Allacma fusca]
MVCFIFCGDTKRVRCVENEIIIDFINTYSVENDFGMLRIGWISYVLSDLEFDDLHSKLSNWNKSDSKSDYRLDLRTDYKAYPKRESLKQGTQQDSSDAKDDSKIESNPNATTNPPVETSNSTPGEVTEPTAEQGTKHTGF